MPVSRTVTGEKPPDKNPLTKTPGEKLGWGSLGFRPGAFHRGANVWRTFHRGANVLGAFLLKPSRTSLHLIAVVFPVTCNSRPGRNDM